MMFIIIGMVKARFGIVAGKKSRTLSKLLTGFFGNKQDYWDFGTDKMHKTDRDIPMNNKKK